jgi:hypothetical protein
MIMFRNVAQAADETESVVGAAGIEPATPPV